jgi:hypothetical protein
MPRTDPLDLPTAVALVRLRLLAEDARRRADDASEAGRHLALIALDGACEYALWLASREHAIPTKERAGVPELYGAVKGALAGWQVSGWPGVSQMHQARNVAQHAASRRTRTSCRTGLMPRSRSLTACARLHLAPG